MGWIGGVIWLASVAICCAVASFVGDHYGLLWAAAAFVGWMVIHCVGGAVLFVCVTGGMPVTQSELYR
jgi:hypothetical protein